MARDFAKEIGQIEAGLAALREAREDLLQDLFGFPETSEEPHVPGALKFVDCRGRSDEDTRARLKECRADVLRAREERFEVRSGGYVWFYFGGVQSSEETIWVWCLRDIE